jgi:acyl-CoA thioester hydrolase
MADLFVTYRGTVYPAQCDHNGHMNVMWYVGKFDEATWQMFAAIGVTPGFMRQNGRGVAAVRQNIAYRRELMAGEVISIRTGVLEMHPRQIKFYHEMLNDETGEVAAATAITGVLLDIETRKPCPFPPDVIELACRRIVQVPLLV